MAAEAPCGIEEDIIPEINKIKNKKLAGRVRRRGSERPFIHHPSTATVNHRRVTHPLRRLLSTQV
jgi:hypothetical protein